MSTTAGARRRFFDPETNRWKNRTDEPAEYHDLSWDSLASLEVPRNSLKYRGEWTDDDKAVLARYEGIPVRVVGFLSGAKQELPARARRRRVLHRRDV